MAVTAHPHIRLDEQGVAWIDDANIYYDHQAQLDAEIAGQEYAVRRLRNEAGESPLATRLKARGLLA